MRRQPHVGVDVDQRGVLVVRQVEVELVELLRQPVGRAAALLPADHPFLLEKRCAVPALDAHPDPTGDQVGAAGQPVRPVTVGHPHLLVEHVGVLGLEVVGSVLEPEQVSRRASVRAWSTRCGRTRAANTAPRRYRSPPGPGCGWRARRPAGRWRRPGRRCRRRSGPGPCVSFGNFGRSASAAGRWSAMPKRSLPSLTKKAGPNPIVSVSADGRQPQRLAGIGRRRVRIEPDGAVVRRLRRRRSSARPSRSTACSIVDHVGLGVGGDVERAEVHPVLRRGDDARPGGRRGTAPACRSPSSAVLGRRARGRPAHRRRPRRRPLRSHPRRRTACAVTTPRVGAGLRSGCPGYWGAMTPCTWLTSLDSASMARESSWRCGSVTLS